MKRKGVFVKYSPCTSAVIAGIAGRLQKFLLGYSGLTPFKLKKFDVIVIGTFRHIACCFV